MRELTFREVIANIKEGEVWEGKYKKIYIQNSTLFVENINSNFDGVIAVGFVLDEIYKLKRKTHSFTEAFKAYEEGKEIECCYGGQILKKENEKDYCFDYEKGKYVPLSFDETFFDITNIRSEWYIND
jgi:hypothetical protein